VGGKEAKRMGGELVYTSSASGLLLYGNWKGYVSCKRVGANFCGLGQVGYMHTQNWKGEKNERLDLYMGIGRKDSLEGFLEGCEIDVDCRARMFWFLPIWPANGVSGFHYVEQKSNNIWNPIFYLMRWRLVWEVHVDIFI
jgi:hypothetical protein